MEKLNFIAHTVFQALCEERGQDLVEYVLIGGVVAVGAIAGMQGLAANLNDAFSSLGSLINTYS